MHTSMLDKIRIASLCLVVATLTPLTAWGQSPGALSGKVTDETGSRASATITVTDQKTGVSLKKKTDESGKYRFDPLPPGDYSVTAEQPGFLHFSKTNIRVFGDATSVVDIELWMPHEPDYLPDPDYVPLLPMAFLSGRVTDNGGAPIVGAIVGIREWNITLIDLRGSFLLDRGADTNVDIKTEANGLFSVALPMPASGQFVVKAESPGFDRSSRNIAIKDGSGSINITLTRKP